MIFSKEVQHEVDIAKQRLNLPSLSELELVAQLKIVQQHNPSTGFHVDTAAVLVISEEIDRRRKLTKFDYTARIKEAEAEAMRGCGLSDVLYESRVQVSYANILAQAPEAERAATEAALKERGYEPNFVPYQAEKGECSLTGIDENCCPCGQHP